MHPNPLEETRKDRTGKRDGDDRDGLDAGTPKKKAKTKAKDKEKKAKKVKKEKKKEKKEKKEKKLRKQDS
eukprot:COSAG02_NODE_2337_length_9110_cov_417.266837_2_plen_70_part_00